jgi:hypothetical protein
LEPVAKQLMQTLFGSDAVRVVDHGAHLHVELSPELYERMQSARSHLGPGTLVGNVTPIGNPRARTKEEQKLR